MTTSSAKKRIIIIGAGYAGILAALRLSGQTNRQQVEIVLVNGVDHFVERIRLHQLAANQPLRQHAYETLLKGTGITFVAGWVTDLAPDKQTVTVQTAAGADRWSYDYLVYALGSTVDTASIPGCAEYAMSLAGEETALALQKALPAVAARGGQVLICGGGLTGIEAATELAETYPTLNVSLVTKGAFGDQLSRRGKAHIEHVFAQLGITLITGRTITRFHPHTVECTGGDAIPFDLCLWAGPFTVPPLARQAGLAVNAQGQIIVDEYLRSRSHPTIYAVGDAATLETALDKPIRMACATASPMGVYAGDHLAATLQGKPGSKPYQFNYALRCISLGRQEALVQWVDTHDRPKERITTGRVGVRIKEMICRGTIWFIYFERRMAVIRSWFKKGPRAEPKLVEKGNYSGHSI